MSQTQLIDPLQQDTRSWGDIAMDEDEDEDEQTQNNTKQENNHPENDQDNWTVVTKKKK